MADEKIELTAEMEQFVEMCFDPKSPYYNRMKDSVLRMFSETMDE